MKKHALYFMSDISGFTNFVTSTEIEHNSHIVSKLLEILIDANTIGLQLAEIEGDALFMFTTNIPQFEKVLDQSKKMLDAFNKYVEQFQLQNICNCRACTTISNLHLKFIIHYGEISFIKVKNFVKPYGEEVIKTHRFLKNSIPIEQYVLISKETIDFYNYSLNKIPTFKAKEEVYDIGKSNYFYSDLTYIKDVKKNNKSKKNKEND